MSSHPPATDASVVLSVAVGDAARRRFWRGLDELEPSTEAVDIFRAEAVRLRRRDFMKLMGASLALASAAGCSRRPLEKIVPFQNGRREHLRQAGFFCIG